MYTYLEDRLTAGAVAKGLTKNRAKTLIKVVNPLCEVGIVLWELGG